MWQLFLLWHIWQHNKSKPIYQLVDTTINKSELPSQFQTCMHVPACQPTHAYRSTTNTFNIRTIFHSRVASAMQLAENLKERE